jgi:hypothetical protein
MGNSAYQGDETMSETHEEKIETHLSNAATHEAAGDKVKAEKSWKYACFYEARQFGIDTKTHIADCCPVY